MAGARPQLSRPEGSGFATGTTWLTSTGAEAAMFAYLLLSAALATGQTEPPAAALPPEPLIIEAPLAPAPAPTSPPAKLPTAPTADRWLLMKALQGTWEGALLDENRTQVSGWSD